MKPEKILKYLLKTILWTIILAVLLVTLLIISVFINWKVVRTGVSRYESDKTNAYHCNVEIMPEQSELGSYMDIKYHKQITYDGSLFRSDSMSLFVRYDAENYEAQKQHILDTYTFFDEPIVRKNGTYSMPVTELSYKDYDLKTVICPSYLRNGLDQVCHNFGIVGFNDSKHIICFLHYDSFDLDYIADVDEDPETAMVKFIDKYFSWIYFDRFSFRGIWDKDY